MDIVFQKLYYVGQKYKWKVDDKANYKGMKGDASW